MSFVNSSEIKPIQVLSDSIQVLLKSRNSHSCMSVVKVCIPPGGFVPALHHESEEEVYFILSGELTVTIDTESKVLTAGELGHILPKTIHSYVNKSNDNVELLAWSVGGPIDEFFENVSEQVKELPNDFPKLMELTERFGIKMVK